MYRRQVMEYIYAIYRRVQMTAKFYKICKICTTIWQWRVMTNNAGNSYCRAKRILKLILAKPTCCWSQSSPLTIAAY